MEKIPEKDYHNGALEYDFLWLIEHLLPPHDRIRGCEIKFPDTCFLVKGRTKYVVKNDKEKCLMVGKNSQ
jgi:hypothetical protein